MVISLLAEPEGLLSFLSEEVGLRELEDMTPASCLLVAHQKYLKNRYVGFVFFRDDIRYLFSFVWEACYNETFLKGAKCEVFFWRCSCVVAGARLPLQQD